MPNNNNNQVVNINNNNNPIDDIKDDDNFKDLKRKFTRLREKLLPKDAEIKQKAWRVAKKIVIGALYDRFQNAENGEWDWDADYFFEGEGDDMMKIFDARDASVDAVSLTDLDYTKEQIKTALEEMIDSLNPNMVGGRRKRKTKKTKKSKKSKKSKRTRRHR